MIITQLLGGLGNQLFQYAAARRLALIHQTPLKLDLGQFETYKLHAYSLQHFSLAATIATPADLAAIRPHRLIRPLAWHHRRASVRERFFHFDPTILRLPDNVYLIGHWQSEKYFSDIIPQLRQELAVRTPPSPQNTDFAARIIAVPAVNVHIRRADYTSDARTNEIHGVTPVSYYRDALRLIQQQEQTAHCFVFSDDAAWAREHLQLDAPTTFVCHNNAATNYEDLRLMTLCRHHIIANSTFGWWGAWLSVHPRKIVIAPRRWFLTRQRDSRDLLPTSWRTL